MAEHTINKGIGRPVEFKGLKSQYLFIFAAGLLADFILFTILYMAGIGQWIAIGVGIVLGLAVVAGTFRLNDIYGTYGLMKMLAARSHPRRIVSRKRITRFFKR